MQQFSDKDETYGHPQTLRWVPFVLTYISMALKEIRFNCQPGGLCLNRFSKLKKKKSYSVSVDHGSFPLTCGLTLPLRNHHRIMISKISQL